MKKVNENELSSIQGGGWFSQMFGRDWTDCAQMAGDPNTGEEGIWVQHGTSWLWGSGVRGC
jgi:bacteriocin-like protein